MSPEAYDYLTTALDFVERTFILRDRVNFAALRRAALAAADEARNWAETYPAIRLALRQLDDLHSFFLDRETIERYQQGSRIGPGYDVSIASGIIYYVFDGTPAERAGVRIGDIVETLDGVPRTEYWDRAWSLERPEPVRVMVRRGSTRVAFDLTPVPCATHLLPEGHALDHDIGYLHFPMYEGLGDDERGHGFAEAAQHVIQEIDRETTRGWIIDLRRNPGGNMWPMVAGVGPILGEGAWDMFESPHGRMQAGYRAGEAFLKWEDNGGAQHDGLSGVDAPYNLFRPDPPVAILTGPITASSGEFVALCFRGLRRARSFGESTAGVPTSPERKQMPDGAILAVAAARGVDRVGRAHDALLEPDEYVRTDWDVFGTDRDPVIQAAVQWIEEMGGNDRTGK